MERTSFSHCQTVFSTPAGVDLLTYSQVTDIGLYRYNVNSTVHSDSASGKRVTHTDYEHFGSECVPGNNIRYFWDKQAPLTVKLRG